MIELNYQVLQAIPAILFIAGIATLVVGLFLTTILEILVPGTATYLARLIAIVGLGLIVAAGVALIIVMVLEKLKG